jgi:hypothetical protein
VVVVNSEVVGLAPDVVLVHAGADLDAVVFPVPSVRRRRALERRLPRGRRVRRLLRRHGAHRRIRRGHLGVGHLSLQRTLGIWDQCFDVENLPKNKEIWDILIQIKLYTCAEKCS